jgi:hypothetical protein
MKITFRSTRLRAVLLLGLGAALAACSDAPGVTAPVAPAPRATTIAAINAAYAGPDAITASSAATLLACPSTVERSATGVIGPRGGTLGVDGSAILVPPGAVRVPTTFTFVVPASPVVQVDVSAAGVEHYQFLRPVAISISYARCDAAALPGSSLGAWWVDSSTLSQLGVMAGVDDRAHRRITFVTDHLSGYAVVY